METYYNGTVGRYASFWAEYRGLSAQERFAEFIKFFKIVKADVETGKCNLQEAALALKPGLNDGATYHQHEADLTFVNDAVEDLIIVSRTDTTEARRIWEYIVSIMGAYL